MALVTVQRSPSVAGSPQCSNSDGEAEDDENSKNEKSECFFAGKDTAMALALKDVPQYTERRLSTDSTRSTNSTQSNNSDIQQHLQSMFYLLRKEETLKMAVKLESQRPNRTRYLVIASCCCYRSATADRKSKIIRHNSAKTSTTAGSTAATGTNPTAGAPHTRQISLDNNPNPNPNPTPNRSQQQQQLQGQLHNQSQTDPSECLEANEKHSSSWSTQCSNRQSLKCDPDRNSACGDSKCTDGIEESCLLGIDCNERTTIGLVVPILADTTIHLDGDGGFSVAVYGKTHIFKPVSVQAMWSALQTLHKVSQKARANNFYPGGPSHDWLYYHESRIESDQSCLNEWNAMDAIESRRPPSPDAIRNKPTAKEETESVIKMKLKEIMMSVDLDEVTSKYIRSRLEEHLDMDLGEYKSFIDAEIMVILGQMDAPTEIFEHVYLGSEWNASNLEELQKNGVRHILNVTREIDNFFPGMFDYFNVRVYDDEKTNLLKHWDNTFRYITRAKSEGSKVLVHCKMGVSRSASVVIAYAMKAYNWEFQTALQHVKDRRSCIKPNKNFLNQLETYRGMLDAMKNKEKLQRSKSETNLKSTKDARLLPGSEPTPLIQALNQSKSKSAGHGVSGDVADVTADIGPDSGSAVGANSRGQRRLIRRSSSTSPKNIPNQSAIVVKQQSQSLENLTPERSHADEPKNVRFPGSNGENYSVTQNQVLHIQKNTPSPLPQNATQSTTSSVRTRIHEMEAHRDQRKTNEERKALNLPFGRSVSQDPSAAENPPASAKSLGSPVWTSSAKLITQTSNLGEDAGLNAMPPALRSSLRVRRNNESGIFCPTKLDEEKKRHSRKTQSWAASSTGSGGIVMDAPSNVATMEGGGGVMRATAKLGSNSSIDSAGSAGRPVAQETVVRTRPRHREPPLRHASWGSGDTRCGMPMRNSSWSSYDTNRNTFQYGSNPAATAIFEGQIHDLHMSNKTAIQNVATNPTAETTPAYQHHGTVKRTKQKLEQSTALKKHCQENGEVAAVAQTEEPSTTTHPSTKKSSNLCRSASAAGASNTRYPLRCSSEEFVATPHQHVMLGRRSDGSRPLPNEIISASAPEPYTLTDIENKNTLLLEADDETAGVLLRGTCQNALEAEANASEEQRVSGSVQILKKNFEAKAGTSPNATAAQAQTLPAATAPKKGTHSLPSSPVAQHVDQHAAASSNVTATPTPTGYFEPPPSQTNCTSSSSSSSSSVTESCDRNVKGLVHKYQTTATTTTASATTATPTATNTTAGSSYGQHKPRPHSCYENPNAQKPQSAKPTHDYSDRRPPQAPAKIAPPTTLPPAGDFHAGQQQQQQQQQQRRLQHGKTHPLARLSLPKQSFNAAAYNTM